jgi:hypothetical protein
MKNVVIPINNNTIHLVTALLNGHTPSIDEKEPTFLIFDDSDNVWEVMSSHEFWMIRNTERGWIKSTIELWHN